MGPAPDKLCPACCGVGAGAGIDDLAATAPDRTGQNHEDHAAVCACPIQASAAGRKNSASAAAGVSADSHAAETGDCGPAYGSASESGNTEGGGAAEGRDCESAARPGAPQTGRTEKERCSRKYV